MSTLSKQQASELEELLEGFLRVNKPSSSIQAGHLQALRVYAPPTEIVLAERGHLDVFGPTLELLRQTLNPPQRGIRFIPLCGGNYVLWGASMDYASIAIFSEDTPRQVGQYLVEATLAILKVVPRVPFGT